MREDILKYFCRELTDVHLYKNLYKSSQLICDGGSTTLHPCTHMKIDRLAGEAKTSRDSILSSEDKKERSGWFF